MSERRRERRWDGRILVEMEDEHSKLLFEAVGLNLSSGGLCLVFPDAPSPQVGSVYGVSFYLPNHTAKVENAVEIRWVDRNRSKICGGAFLRGLRAIEVYSINELLSLDED